MRNGGAVREAGKTVRITYRMMDSGGSKWLLRSRGRSELNMQCRIVKSELLCICNLNR